MRGEFLPIWSETWRDIWTPLAKSPSAPSDLFSELYRELSQAFVSIPTPESLADAVDDPKKARATFRRIKAGAFSGEEGLVKFFEQAHSIMVDLGGDALANRYFLLVEAVLAKFSLRYDLRRPFTLHPTPSGIYTKLYLQLVSRCQQDASLSVLLRDYREAFQDLGFGATSGRINTCFQKQVNLLEGLASLTPGVTASTLGQMCNEIRSWPSTAVSEAAKSLYGFASDHTGLRHGTIKKSKIGKTPTIYRDMEIRDLVAVSAFFTGLVAYLSDQIDPQRTYGR